MNVEPKDINYSGPFLRGISMECNVLNYKVWNKLYKTYSFSGGTPKSNKNAKPLMKSNLL